MVTDDYLVTMEERNVGVAELKAKLSEYLRMVRRGEELTVYDRDQPIARLVPLQGAAATLAVREPVAGYGARPSDVSLPPPAGVRLDAVDVLLEDRRER